MSSNKNSIQNMQSTDFVNIQLLECNRKFSQEVQGGNQTADDSKARFTNRVKETKINIGDKISVANVFANQRGASSEVIQFDGVAVNTDHTQEYTKTLPFGDYGVQGSPSGRSYTKTTNFQVTTIPQDNQASILYNFYKNKNGENHITLPRSWCGSNIEVAKKPRTEWTPLYPDDEDGGTISVDYKSWREKKETTQDTIQKHSGIPKNFTNQSGVATNFYVPLSQLLSADWKQVSFVNENQGAVQNNSVIPASRVDNSRYMLFRIQDKNANMINADNPSAPQDPVTYNIHGGQNRNAVYYEFPTDDTDYYNSKDPAIDFIYLPYTEILQLEVGRGYLAPVNVADRLTQQLTEEIDRSEIQKTIGTAGNTFTETLTATTETPTMKPFPCGSCSDWSEDYYYKNRDYQTTDTKEQKRRAMQYVSNYEIVGFKRPEIVKAIRNNSQNVGLFQPASHFVRQSLLKVVSANQPALETSIPWSQMNLLAMKEIFDAQALYDELWDWNNNDFLNQSSDDNTKVFYRDYVKKTNSRYMNFQATNDSNQADAGVLGSDMYVESLTAQDPAHPKDHISNVLWIDYDPSTADFYEDTYQQTKLNYGFATKYKHSDGKDYILIHVNGSINGIGGGKYLPDYLFSQFDGGGAQIPLGNKIGFDFHFSAFGHGNSIALYSGYLDWYYNSLNIIPPTLLNADNDVQYQARGKWDKTGAVANKDLYRITGNIRQVYVGSNSPLINFNETASRFEISNLHSSEYIGNNECAGSNIKDHAIASVPDFMNAVYKLNKRSNFFNFCPDLNPYTMIWKRSDTSNKETTPVLISDISPYLDKYHPYDSNSGITMLDWGYNLVESSDRYRKNTWNEGIWSKLGYEQKDLVYDGLDITFEKNYNFKFTNLNINQSKALTTNAIISINDAPNYVANVFGNSIMNYQLPLSSYLYGMDGAVPPFDPAINIVQTSSVLQASLFPKKMENGFFCIRSNIIPNTQYSGSKYGGTELNVVAVCNKENAESDFYFSENSQMEFTATKPFVISEITTSIHKPNQELADLDDNSCVIYKIEKNIMQQTNLISDILTRTN